MYCQKCGSQISDEAIYCNRCGNKIVASFSRENMKEIDRKASIIYLEDLLKFEYIMRGIENDIKRNNEERNIAKNSIVKKPEFPTEPVVPKIDHREIIEFSFFVATAVLIIPCLIAWYASSIVLALEIYIIGYLIFFAIFEFNATSFDSYEEKYNIYRKNAETYRADVARYQRDMFIYNNLNPKNELIIKQIDNTISELQTEQRNIREELERAYSINFIPQMFRNLEGVYGIYQFFTTSNIPYESVLNLIKLDKIEKKLDTVLYQVNKLIIMQHENKELLRETAKKNQEYFSDLINRTQMIQGSLNNIETTASNVETYTKMAEYNSRVAAYISASQFLETHSTIHANGIQNAINNPIKL